MLMDIIRINVIRQSFLDKNRFLACDGDELGNGRIKVGLANARRQWNGCYRVSRSTLVGLLMGSLVVWVRVGLGVCYRHCFSVKYSTDKKLDFE